jgi:hypothetical protein
MNQNLSIIKKVWRFKMKVKMVNSAGCVLDFESIRDADQHLKSQWRDFAFVAYGKDQFGKTPVTNYLGQ